MGDSLTVGVFDGHGKSAPLSEEEVRVRMAYLAAFTHSEDDKKRAPSDVAMQRRASHD